MKSSTTSAVLAIAAFSSCSLAAITMEMSKTPFVGLKNRRRDISTRASFSEALGNNFTAGNYMINVEVGTPPQKIAMAIDTGSSDVWVLDVAADLCTEPILWEEYGTGCQTPFDPSKSSSYKDIGVNEFAIQYGDGTGAEGDYFTDVLNLGGTSLKAQTMGIAYNATLSPGLLGVGYDLNEASDDPSTENTTFVYSSVVDSMVSQGLISSKAYSLYLNDLDASTGAVIFGGIDTDKYHGNLLQLPIIPDQAENGSSIYAEFAVGLTSYSITYGAGNTTTLTKSDFDEPCILDSGTALTYLPDTLVGSIVLNLNGFADDGAEGSGLYFVDCGVRTSNPSMTFNYGFGGSKGVVIEVPVNEMIYDTTGLFDLGGYVPQGITFTDMCVLGLQSVTAGGSYILGDTFLRSAYVVYDLKNNVVAIAQTNFNSTTSNIIDISADATAIPNVSGIASQTTSLVETATGVLPIGKSTGTSKTATSTGAGFTGTKSSANTTPTSSSSSSSSTSTKPTSNAGAALVPAFDVSGLMVMGLTSGLVLLGGGLIFV